jgi:prepilin-type N-terminal cleavage/methylation domain-containing protein
MTRRTQQGFTLVEVMVVVAILAILASLAVVSVKPRTSAVDAGHQFRALVDQASREAVRAGAVRPDVATALALRARTQVVAQMNGDTLTFYVQRLVEDPAPAASATWQTLDTFTLPSWVHAAAYSSQLGGYSSIAKATDWDAFSIACFPDGTCERKTVFFESSTGATSTRQSRVAVLPVASAQVIGKWN